MNKYRIIVEVTDTADGEIAYTKETLKSYVQHQLAEDEETGALSRLSRAGQLRQR